MYLVTQVGNWVTGSDDVGLIQSTKAPKFVASLFGTVGSMGVGGGGALDSLAAERLRRAPSWGPLQRGGISGWVAATIMIRRRGRDNFQLNNSDMITLHVGLQKTRQLGPPPRRLCVMF